jgi:hypothetical protein
LQIALIWLMYRFDRDEVETIDISGDRYSPALVVMA